MTEADDLIRISKSLESLSKRLRKVEIRSNRSVAYSDSFLALTDTPNEYAGYAGKTLVVNVAEDGVHFEPFGSSCVTFVCGAYGWRGTGGASPRTLIHEWAFQLTEDGNDRGEGVVDLQQLHWPGYSGIDVAASDYSSILGGEENIIEIGSPYCTITGPYNSIDDTNWGCHAFGSFNYYDGDGYSIIGSFSNYVHETDYAYLFGYNHDAYYQLSCWSMGETNKFLNSGYYAYNSGLYGLFNEFYGEHWISHVFGEDSKLYSLGAYPDDAAWNMLVGYRVFAGHVYNNYLFGTYCKSYRPSLDHLYDGRIVLADGSRATPPADGTNYNYGYNQDSWFSQDDWITTWTTSWVSSRFQFPLIISSTWNFVAYIVGTEQYCANVYFWKVEGTIKNAAGTSVVVHSIVTNCYRDVITKEWQVVADDANDRLVFQFRDTAGPDSTICNIQLSMKTVEVGAYA